MRINQYDSLGLPWNQFTKRLGNYNAKAIDAAAIVRGAANYEPYCIAFPARPNQEVIAARGFFQGRASVSPRTFIIGVLGYSEQAAGFKLQLKDLGTGRNLFKSPIDFRNCTGQATTNPRNQVHYLPEAQLVKYPCLIEVQITNLATVANRIQVCIQTAQPTFEEVTI